MKMLVGSNLKLKYFLGEKMKKKNRVKKKKSIEIPAEKKIDANRDSKTGRFVPGNRANPLGREVGIRDKATEIKLAFFVAFEKTGGAEGMIAWAKKNDANRRELYKLVVSSLPKDLTVEGVGTKIINIHYTDTRERMQATERIEMSGK